MAITIINQPDSRVPMWQPLFFQISGTNVNNYAYRYRMDIFSGANTTTEPISTKYLTPQSADKLGRRDIQEEIQALRDKSRPDWTGTTFQNNSGNCYDFSVAFGDSFSRWEFQTNTTSSGNLRLNSTQEHGLSVGDVVSLNLDTGYPTGFQAYIGSATVLSIPNTQSVVLSTTYLGVSATVSGYLAKTSGVIDVTGVTTASYFIWDSVLSDHEYLSFTGESKYSTDNSASGTGGG